jgi:hypothetical protein
MRRCRWIAILTMLGLLVGLNGGCLSLSLFNRETPDIKGRLEGLEKRVGALETANNAHSCTAVATPGTPIPSQAVATAQ